jgi:hypothetical protein
MTLNNKSPASGETDARQKIAQRGANRLGKRKNRHEIHTAAERRPQ